MTDQEMMERMREFVTSRDDENGIESCRTEAETALDVLEEFVEFLGWPAYRELSEIELAERTLAKAHAAWRKALEELNTLKEAEYEDGI